MYTCVNNSIASIVLHCCVVHAELLRIIPHRAKPRRPYHNETETTINDINSSPHLINKPNTLIKLLVSKYAYGRRYLKC